MKKSAIVLVCGGLALFIASGCSTARAETQYFRVCAGPAPNSCGTPDDFVVALSKPDQIEMANKILSGAVTDQVHVAGTISSHATKYNAPWKFHLLPRTISFFTFAHPTCWGFSTRDVNDNLDKVGSPDFLPTRAWCPRGYRLADRVSRREHR